MFNNKSHRRNNGLYTIMSEEIKINEVYVSIVTLPKESSLEIGSETFNRFKSTYTEYKEYLNDKQVVQSYLDDAGKSVAFSKVYQIALGFELNDEIRVNILNGEESNIIRRFHNILTSDFFKNSKLYGYNNKFIYDVLFFRGRVCKIPLELEAPQFKDIKNQSWKQTKSICLMDETASNYRGKISLLNALYAANLDYSNIISGDEIFSLYSSENFIDISRSSAATIKGLVNLNRFLHNKSEIKQLACKDEVIGEIVKKDVNVLEHILAAGNLSTPIIEKIVEFTEANNLNRDNVLTLVKVALSKNKEYQKVEEEDFLELKDALGLSVDYSKIQVVVDKGNLGKKECNSLTKLYEKSSEKERKEVVSLTEQFLIEKGKIGQKRTSESLKLLKVNLSTINRE